MSTTSLTAPRLVGPRSLATVWAWGWLAVVHLVLDVLLAVPFLCVAVLVVVGVSLLPAFLAGVPVLAVSLVLAMGIAAFERARLLAFTGIPVLPPRPPRSDQGPWRRILLDTRPWRAAAYLALEALWGLTVGTTMLVLACVAIALACLPLYRPALPDAQLALPWTGFIDVRHSWPVLWAAGLAGLGVLPLVARGVIAVDVTLVRYLLGRSHTEEVRELSERVQTLTETRVATVDSVEAERRRIERDLHDGPQQRLVAIAMDLGMAREKLPADPAGARELLDKAHAAAKDAIVEMRQVARGIAPPVLTDRGLDAALSALAARAPFPVAVEIELAARPSPTLEAIAYFCVSEALTNVAKHAQARTARVEVFSRDDVLTVRVSDDGIGGADAARGTGLNGLRDRVRAVDGTLTVDSEPGRGTLLTVTLPDIGRRAAANPYAPPHAGGTS